VVLVWLLVGAGVGFGLAVSSDGESKVVTERVAAPATPTVGVAGATADLSEVRGGRAPGQVSVDPGAFPGAVKVLGPQLYADALGGSRVDAQVQYLGGAGCDVLRYIGLGATLFDESGRIVENGFGNAANLAKGSHFPFTIRFDSGVSNGRAELVVTDLECG
jgi:hypothetical protein